MRRILGCQSDGAAHQRILRVRREYPLILQGFLDARALDRLTWFTAPAEAVLARQPVPALDGALVARAMTVDGIEDGTLGAPAWGQRTWPSIYAATQPHRCAWSRIAASCARPYGDSESDQVRCTVCGADGLA